MASLSNDRSTKQSRQSKSDLPTYTIDLSLPPSQRYVQIATDFAPQLRYIVPLFDAVVLSYLPHALLKPVKLLARVLLRRVFSSEETAELKGISAATSIQLHLLVAFNVLLDSLMGCTSGGVRVRPRVRAGQWQQAEANRMLHFRTLDWDMPGLRRLMVVLEYVRSGEDGGRVVLGRSITYAGFIGVLTGVRPGFSISLNFRPSHTCSSFQLYTHQLLVMLGFRPSISSLLRQYLVPSQDTVNKSEAPRSPAPPDLASFLETFPSTKTTACYVIASDGSRTAVLEKDYTTAHCRSASDFIVHTNHDTCESTGDSSSGKSKHVGMELMLEESQDRMDGIAHRWRSVVRRQAAKTSGPPWTEGDLDTGVGVTEATVVRWIEEWPVSNECTHFACLMDPARDGRIRWLRAWWEPRDPPTKSD